MKKNKINFYDEIIYSEKLDNGFEIYVLPNKNVSDAFVTITTRYGGVNYPFKLNNKVIKVPNGIAHFLEHKMFEQEDGIDPFMYYNNTGTYCNAYTSYDNTTYLFAGNTNIYDNLDYLLRFVFSPYFTDENVEKEKGIIKEEIKMYDDMPDNIIVEKSMYNLFNTNPIKYSVAGTTDDVESITKEDLYNCYNAFYNPNNMFLVVTGNIDYEKVINVVKNFFKDKKYSNNKVEVNKTIEKDTVYKKKEVIKHNVSTPYVSYSIKIPINKYNIDKKKLNLYFSTIFNILFDETSIFYEKMKDNKYLDTSIDIDDINTDTHKVFIISFKSDKYKEVIKEIDNTLKNISISKSDLERKKKVNLSNLLYIFDDISRTNKMILNNILEYNDLYLNIHKLIKEMNIDELNDIINNLNLNNKSILVIENRE